MTNDEILDAPMEDNDGGAKSLRDYFYTLLITLWEEGEGFSGKRPFGNSGWDNEIYTHLVKIKAIKGTIDMDGYLVDFTESKANKLIAKLIKHCFYPVSD